ncbi:response regulator [Pseudobacter ginsenosidimutans]|uniref:CRP-like cAMP-binding protein n=1 Tax=Pseudobacter ginsenosidimutans TaxID=661488 RepID=A0A4Q7MLW0_9BACT|nr:response regulator [Pseudobacter ginsenosidimutans]QEC45724.1 response regulator [Pseudobacter ginsenosidimutans]RZS69334.1 CRP-like cAMP-binding protein [Pseudobacter ginsenosidimutans]
MKTILVIDDNTDIRENTAEILTLAGYQTYTAENGKRGVEIAGREKPDLIVCDIMMPELDGYGVLHLLKNRPETEHIPFIFLTAKTERGDFRKGMELGADDYITKPFDDIELLKAIEIRLKKLNIIQAQYAQGEQGANELLKELKGSGLITLDPNEYDSERIPKKSIVYHEGKRPKFLYHLKSGKIKTFRIHEDGKEYITNLYSAGDYLGHVALLENSSYDDTAEVLEEAEVVMIPKEDFVTAVFNDMNIATRFIKLISRDVKEKEERLLRLAYDSLRKRVAKALVDIQQKFNPNGDQQAIDIPREDIAQYVGTATESLIRTLSDFKSEKLIEIREGKIRILQAEKLRNLLF